MHTSVQHLGSKAYPWPASTCAVPHVQCFVPSPKQMVCQGIKVALLKARLLLQAVAQCAALIRALQEALHL